MSLAGGFFWYGSLTDADPAYQDQSGTKDVPRLVQACGRKNGTVGEDENCGSHDKRK